MSLTRTISWIVSLLLAACLWAFLNGAKNDLLPRTRLLIRQLRETREEQEARPFDLQQGEKTASTYNRFFLKYRFPEEAPDAQEPVFEGLWQHLGYADPETVKEIEAPEPMEFENTQLRRRRLTMDTEEAGDSHTLELDWVLYRGSWYLQNYRLDGEEPRPWGMPPLPGRGT